MENVELPVTIKYDPEAFDIRPLLERLGALQTPVETLEMSEAWRQGYNAAMGKVKDAVVQELCNQATRMTSWEFDIEDKD